MSNKTGVAKDTAQFREQLLKRLDTLNRRILGLGAALSNKNDDQKVRYLAKGGFTQPEIETLLCKDQAEVSKILAGKKKKGES